MSSWLVEALIGSTLLMLLVLAVRRPVARLWGAHFAYALWALPLLRMILPPLPGWQSLYAPVAGARPDGGYAVAIVPAADAAYYTQPLPVPDQGTLLGLVSDWPTLLLILWAVGAALWLAAQWARHLRFVGQAVREGTPLTTTGGVEVIMSTAVPGPMAAGVLRRRILLPADFLARYSPAERRLTLLHEGAHHDRGDLVANLAGLLVLALHWWNPVAHVAWRAFRADQELACDATVLAGSDGPARAVYAGAVLKSACVATPIAACAMNHKSQLKERIGMMKDRKFGTLRRLFGGLAVAGIAASALAATASGQPASPQPPEPPAPPAAPAPPAPPEPPVQGKKVMIIKHKHAGPDAAAGKGRTVRVIVKDGAVVSTEDAELAELQHDLAAEARASKDGRRVLMIRHHELAAASAAAAHGAESAKAAQAEMARVKDDMRADCSKQGISMPAEADIGQLAMCGRDIQKEVREALAEARKSVAEDAGLSDAQRAKVLKGLDAAGTKLRREVIVKIER